MFLASRTPASTAATFGIAFGTDFSAAGLVYEVPGLDGCVVQVRVAHELLVGEELRDPIVHDARERRVVLLLRLVDKHRAEQGKAPDVGFLAASISLTAP